MYQRLIQKYIQNLSKDDILHFAQSQGITLTESELQVFYDGVKQHWETLLYQDPTMIFQTLKQQVRPQTYQKVVELYQYFKQKYQSYL